MAVVRRTDAFDRDRLVVAVVAVTELISLLTIQQFVIIHSFRLRQDGRLRGLRGQW